MTNIVRDPRSMDELFQVALGPEGDAAWGAVSALHWRGTEDVLDRCIALSGSRDAKERARATDVLGQLGVPHRTFPEQCFDLLLKLLSDEDLLVVSSAIMGLQHLDCIRAKSHVLPYAHHENDNVRYAVAVALGCIDDAAATAALLELMKDRNDEIRDWATFGIGQLSDVDSREIRSALADRLSDPDADVRYEASIGLARRGDKRSLDSLIAILNTEPDDNFAREAAANLLNIGDGENYAASDILKALEGVHR